MKYKTSSSLRSSAGGRPACWPGRLRDWEQDRRSGSRSAGSEAIVMRAGPAGRLARASARRRTSPERRQSEPSKPAEGRQNTFDASNLLKSIDFRALRLRRKKCEAFFCESVAKMQQPCPCAEGAPAQRHMFCLCARRVAFFREGKFFVSLDFRTPPRLPFGRASERKQNKENNSTCLWFLCLPSFPANNSGPRKLQRAKLEEVKEFSKKSGRRRQGQIAAVAKQARLTAILFSF